MGLKREAGQWSPFFATASSPEAIIMSLEQRTRMQEFHMFAATGCAPRDLLLHDEMNAWTAYWTAMTEKILLLTEIDRLKQDAFNTTTALKNHALSCPLCQRSQKHRWFWPE